jgi:two-component system, NtrC family, nitrogen regulation sensor histidine kinase GlnL
LIDCPRGEIERNMRLALASGQPFAEREVAMPLPDGREITVDCTLSPIRDGDHPVEVLVELQPKDRQLRISREERLIAQHQAVRDLVRGLAHEIKNPLGGLRGAAQLLERELPDPTLREYTQIIIDEADRLRNLVNRMLGPSKLPDPEEINIHQILERVRSLARAECGDRVEIGRDYDPSIPALVGDREQLIQALLNLVRNATQAVDLGGKVVLRTRILRQFTIGGERYRLVVKIDIQDNGPGIPPELMPRIFYPMVGAREGGSGLGLSIAQALVNRHRGLIECASRPGETIFSVLLPVEVEHVQGN